MAVTYLPNMNLKLFFLTKLVFGIIAAIFTLLGTILAFGDEAQNKKSQNIQGWFRKKWEAVNTSRWFELPENTTRWLLNSRTRIIKVLQDAVSDRVLNGLLISIPVLFFLACLAYWGTYAALSSLIFSFPLALLPVKALDKFTANRLLQYYLLVVLTVSSLLTAFLSLQVILNQNLYYAALIMILIIPFFWFAIFFPLIVIDEFFDRSTPVSKNEDSIALFNIGVACGFSVTLVAMSVGHLVEPSANVPQTLQMLISNVMFDGLTMAVTFAILSWAVSKKGLWRLPIAILLDIIVAAAFAGGSLYFGLIFTDKALTIQDVLFILIARSTDNSHFEFAPYFWIMHTTFIPTVLYLSLILFCWTGMAILTPVKWFFGKGQEHTHPLKLAGLLCGVFAAVFAILAVATGFVQEGIKELGVEPSRPASIENHN